MIKSLRFLAFTVVFASIFGITSHMPMCIVFELEERIAKSQIFLLQEAVFTLDTFQMERLSACPNWHELLKYLLVVCRFRIA